MNKASVIEKFINGRELYFLTPSFTMSIQELSQTIQVQILTIQKLSPTFQAKSLFIRPLRGLERFYLKISYIFERNIINANFQIFI